MPTIKLNLSSEEHFALSAMAKRAGTSPTQLALAGVRHALGRDVDELPVVKADFSEAGVQEWEGTSSGPSTQVGLMFQQALNGTLEF